MWSRLFPLFLMLFVCALPARAATVIESESTIIFRDRTAELTLVIDSKGRTGRSSVDLELLDAGGSVLASASPAIRLKNGKHPYKVSMNVGEMVSRAGDGLAWYRLRYRADGSDGIISLSELLKDDFELRVAAFERVVPGQVFRTRVRTLHPLTRRPVKRVAVAGELELEINTDSDEDELLIKARGVTNGDGLLVLDFKVPANVKLDGDGVIRIRGTKRGIVRKVDESLESTEQLGNVILTADKPLYQPGQNFSARGIYLDANNTVVPDAELEFTIEGEDDTVLYRETVKTSAFGIASISWTIPENAKLGSYRVVVEADDDLRSDQLGFKVSRYDLPNFSVSAKPDRSYYLPEDAAASITVSADYLFGKPVTGGKVRVVQEKERRWNWREQKYDIDEGETVEGNADANGKFVARFDLSKENQDLKASEWRRYKDVSFAAYFTDPTTNRTEQKRFEIRLTKEPIHIYLIRNMNHHPDLPLTAYVSTFYADGTPAVCDVEIAAGGERRSTLDRFKTNSLGAGKFSFTIPQELASGRDLDVAITARDKKGQVGTFSENFDLDRDGSLQMATSRAIHKPGEPIEVSLVSTEVSGYIYVDVVKDWAVVDSRIAILRGGKASVSIPYRPEFKGELTVAAYSDQETYYWDNTLRASHGIIYPSQQNLAVSAKFSNATYKPSEDAKVRFSVLDGRGSPIESALGIAVLDKAVEERAKTDAEFGGYFRGYSFLMGYETSFGNLSLKDLNDLDLSKPVPAEVELAAEVMLAGNSYYPQIYHGGGTDTQAQTAYKGYFATQLSPVANLIATHFDLTGEFPSDEASVRSALAKNGIDLSGLKDPWGGGYYLTFATEGTKATDRFRTAGPDKVRGTDDDFEAAAVSVQYFKHVSEGLDKAIREHHRRTGGYIRDVPALAAEALNAGIDLASLKDRWGRDYRVLFEVSGRSYVIRIRSLGPDGVLEDQLYRGDDFDVSAHYTDYFYQTENRMNEILNAEVNTGKKPFPKTEAEFIAMLKNGGLDLADVKDGYDRPVYLASHRTKRYVDRSTYENGKQIIKPVTDELLVFSIKSRGANLSPDSDDTELAKFSTVVTEMFAANRSSKADVRSVAYSGGRGAISGTVVDAAGAVIPNASVTATSENDGSQTFSARTDDNGFFLLSNLPSGRYEVRIDSPGFRTMITAGVDVRSQNLAEMSVTLEVGAVSETVSVTAAADTVENSMSASVTVTARSAGVKISFPQKDQTSTPRLREYFPETLVWQPELVTDKKGRAELSFKMADNITTWKMFAIASTKKGKVGVVESEIVAFQPFFVDLDPPKFLTEGDEVHLPTQVRNYTEKKQQVKVTMAKADWFSFLGPDSQSVSVEAGNSNNSVFGFKAVSAVKAGKQRVTAIARSDSDAIEKPVTVRPDGQEIVRTESKVTTGPAAFDLNFPSVALPRTQRAELKIYPNLFAHVAESVEGLLQRPYGCGEQTISSTYPNLMILKFVADDSKVRDKAEKFLRKGYDRLLGYQAADGGFSYWGGKDESDPALTAYALRFLNDADAYIDVDANAVKHAEDWLVKQQRPDGSWTKRYYYETSTDTLRAKIFTSYIARTLAMRKNSDKAVLGKALEYLRARNNEIDEPYALALFGLASLDAGDKATASKVAAQLEKMAIEEGGAVYWKLETNTPFYGWGTAGRIETTALVVNLLIRDAEAGGSAASERKNLINKGTLFMLRSKDRYGVWYSTQTTINVLDAFLAALGTKPTSADQTLAIALNGQVIQNVTIPPDKIDPVIVDLTERLDPASNTVEVRGPGGASLMTQVVASHYVDWRNSDASGVQTGPARALRLDYRCDKQAAAIMQEVTCAVEAERIGHRGYGMLLAEIGTPPGADVSRESLQAAIDADWNISRYEILPDRIVVYMWAKPGGSKFSFKFKPRYGINAQTPASVVYDYYNPEAQAVAVPLRFNVR